MFLLSQERTYTKILLAENQLLQLWEKRPQIQNCNYKTPATSTAHYSTGNKHSNKEQQHLSKQYPNPNMELDHDRPPLGDIFAPPRQALNDHNAYLLNVGLIILIRGTPTHDLPRLIAENLAESHGGHPTDFVVTQATITPFIVTCRNVHLRDTIVRRGIYTIPPARVQYTIHEWRARFGMGYDPTTHQVWVKIVGLLLQAWTTEEITAILHSFGHPMQILPYGQEAGHFVDITALVATKNPNRIPLAYTYREGEYATKIEIIILSWRLWNESYFPPPDRNNCPHCSHAHHRDQAGPSNPQQRSPSSSDSSAAPSEPTIDLSAWSPRSRQIVPYTTPRCSSQVFYPRQSLDGNKPRGQQEKWIVRLPRLLQSHCQKEAPTHERTHALATPDPALPRTPAQLFSLFYACLAAVPNPITINSIRSLWTTNGIILFLGEAQKKKLMTLYCNFSLTRCTVDEENPAEKIWIESGAIDAHPRKEINSEARERHLQPILTPPLGLSHLLTSAQKKLLTTSPNDCQAHPNLNEACNDPNKMCTGQSALNDHNAHQKLFLPLSPSNEPLDFSTHISQIQTAPDNAMPNTENSTPLPQGDKQRALPTRRSQRLLEKRSSFCLEKKTAKKSKSQACKISFLDDSHQTPLDVTKTIEILLATGLTINGKIEEIIEEAVKQDQHTEDTEQNRPTTPLHDLIPPLAVPGSDLLL